MEDLTLDHGLALPHFTASSSSSSRLIVRVAGGLRPRAYLLNLRAKLGDLVAQLVVVVVVVAVVAVVVVPRNVDHILDELRQLKEGQKGADVSAVLEELKKIS